MGSTTAQRLIEAGHHVVVFDSLVRGYRQSLPDGAELVVGDITERESVEGALRQSKADAVLHCAGMGLVGESVTKPDEYYRVNVGGGLTLLEAMRATGVRRIVFSSSAAVYGQPEQTPITEAQPLRPINPYGDTKRAFEGMLDSFTRAYGMSAVSLRYFNAAGATDKLGEDHRPETHLIPNILAAVKRGVRFRSSATTTPRQTGRASATTSTSTTWRRPMAPRWSSRQATKAATRRATSVPAAATPTWRCWAPRARVLGHQLDYVFTPRRAGDPPVLVASNDRAHEVLGWKPQLGIEDMIESAWRWREAHPDGYGG